MEIRDRSGRSRRIACEGVVVAGLALLFAMVPLAGATSSRRPALNDDPEWPILIVEQTGGHILAGASLARIPDVYLTADRRLITRGTGITTARRPTALPSLVERRLTAGGIERLRMLATLAGLEAIPPDYGRPAIADATTTRVTYRGRDGRTYVHRAYALGVTVGVDPAATAARRRLQRFLAWLDAPIASIGMTNVGPARPFVISGFEIAAMRVRATPPVTGGSVLVWPISTVRLDAATSCTPVTGPDAQRLVSALRRARPFTRWRQDGGWYVVSSRPVLPAERPCG